MQEDKNRCLIHFIITFFFGWTGIYKFKEKKIVLGFIYLCTFGLFGFGWFIDVVKSFICLTRAYQSESLIMQEERIRYRPQPVYQSPPVTYDNNEDFDALEGHDFEYYCAELLKKNGFYYVDVTRGSGDQGIDILAQKDEIKYGIQCKCYSSNIGNKAVQEAYSGKAFYNCHVAAVLTNRYFTDSAKELAERNGVLLWDRDKLIDLLRTARESA